jgi:hypothetical protein
MAYFSQEMKKAIAPEIKAICKKYGVKATLGVEHHSGVVLNISSSNTLFKDLNGKYIQVNSYRINESSFSGKEVEFLNECYEVLNDGNHNRSDSQTDFFDIGWYVYINIGRWNKHFVYGDS